MPWLLKMLRSRPQNGEGLCRKTLSSGLQSPPHRPLHWRLKRPRRPDHPTEPAHTCKTWLALLRTSSCSFWTCWERARALMRFTAPAVEKMKKMFTTESHEIAMAAASISALSPIRSPETPQSPSGDPPGHRTPHLPPSRLSARVFLALLNRYAQPWRLHRCKGDLSTTLQGPGPTERRPSHLRQTSRVAN